MSETRTKWSEIVSEDIRDLINSSVFLLKTSPEWKTTFKDYSFVVFPAAKAYEGFLKKLFLDLNLISPSEYTHKYFRVGKVLSPEWEEGVVYKKIVYECNDAQLAEMLWTTWKECRNKISHYFPQESNSLTISQAEVLVNKIISTIESAHASCKFIKR